MKAIAIQQPFASFIAMGIIDVWSVPFTTDYRGRVLIVATDKGDAQSLPSVWRHVLYNHDMMHNMDDIFFIDMDDIVSYSLSMVVGYADIVDSSDKPEDFDGNIWYRGGTALQFVNPHYFNAGLVHEVKDFPQGIFDVPGIDGRATRHFVQGTPFYPFYNEGNLFIQQSVDAYYHENDEDYNNQTMTVWFYADDPYMQVALTGKVGGTDLMPCCYVCNIVDGDDFYIRHKFVSACVENNSDGELCFKITVDDSSFEHISKNDVQKPVFMDYKENGYSLDEKGALFTLDHKRLNRVPLYIGDYVIPNGVESIEDEACEFCNGLTSVILPDSVKRIGHQAFQHCKDLHTIQLGKGIEEIEDYAFYGCEKLKHIIIPKGYKEHFCEIDSLREVKHLIIEK